MIAGLAPGRERRAKMRAGEQDIERVADGARHRDVAGDHQIERQSGDLDDRSAVDQAAMRAATSAPIKSSAGSRVAISDGIKEIMLQRDRALGVGDSLLQRPGLLHQKPVVAPFMQLREVFRGRPRNSPRTRNGSGQAKAPIRSASRLLAAAAEQLINYTANCRLERGDPAWRERLGGQPADSVMQRWIDLDDVGHVAVAFREYRGDRVRQRRRFQRAARRKRFVILEDGEDVVIAGDDPQIELRVRRIPAGRDVPPPEGRNGSSRCSDESGSKRAESVGVLIAGFIAAKTPFIAKISRFSPLGKPNLILYHLTRRSSVFARLPSMTSRTRSDACCPNRSCLELRAGVQ